MDLEELVRRIRFGDKTAIRDLISIYGNSVYARAFERTQDKELAREAARQTFGQFVSVVQSQPDEDGWSLWFGDLIERNIAAYAQVGSDMSVIESELERELYDAPQPAAAPPARPVQNAAPQRTAPEELPPLDKASRSSGRSGRDETFDEAYAAVRKRKRNRSHPVTVILLVIVCLLLLWVVGGVAMTMKWIPFYDLGYGWFNTHIFQLF